MENVVYFLGAGFSAPLGLPVMSNFLEMSKDQFAATRGNSEGEKYEYFSQIYEDIKYIHTLKSFYKSDLTNIEEILSILEMGELFNSGKRELFNQFIVDVIKYYTPSLDKVNKTISSIDEFYHDLDLENNGLWLGYWLFVANLFNLKVEEHISRGGGGKSRLPFLDFDDDYETNYNVITLNYDMVLEKCCKALNNLFNRYNNINIHFGSLTDTTSPVRLAKLHGSVQNKRIIAPTWNKFLNPESESDKAIINNWELAYQVLKEATQIRIIGYSLPLTDTYVRYLFKSAVIDTFNLKKVDVICVDPTGEVRKRYDDFVLHKNYRFVSYDFAKFLKKLSMIKSHIHSIDGIKTVKFNTLESLHDDFMIDPKGITQEVETSIPKII